MLQLAPAAHWQSCLSALQRRSYRVQVDLKRSEHFPPSWHQLEPPVGFTVQQHPEGAGTTSVPTDCLAGEEIAADGSRRLVELAGTRERDSGRLRGNEEAPGG